jgi:hypothetical protein
MSRTSSLPFSIRIQDPLAPTVLSRAALALAPGDSMEIPELANPLNRDTDIQWQTVSLFYDPTRRIAMYEGKAASGQSIDYNHYLYDESTNAWRTTGQPFTTDTGHAWANTFDPASGDYFSHIWSRDYTDWMELASETWRTTTPHEGVNNTSPPVGAIVWHPNLFGPGDGGFSLWQEFRFYAWRRATDEYVELTSYSDGDALHARQNGGGVYLPGLDVSIMYARAQATGEGVRIRAGAGGVAAQPQLVPEPPIAVRGAGGKTVRGHVCVDPSNPSAALILEQYGDARVWRSVDAGESWTLLPFTHPFNPLLGGITNCFIVTGLPTYGVLWGMASDGPEEGHRNVLWRMPG